MFYIEHFCFSYTLFIIHSLFNELTFMHFRLMYIKYLSYNHCFQIKEILNMLTQDLFNFSKDEESSKGI